MQQGTDGHCGLHDCGGVNRYAFLHRRDNMGEVTAARNGKPQERDDHVREVENVRGKIISEEERMRRHRERGCGWTESGRLGLDEKRIIEECEQRIESEKVNSENPLVQEDIDSVIGTQYVTNNLLLKFIEKLKYNDKIQLLDNKLYIVARRAYQAEKGGAETAKEWREEAVEMITRITNWREKKH